MIATNVDHRLTRNDPQRQIPISSITSISPKNVAGSIPNAIEILHEPLAPGRNSSIKSSGNDGDTQRSLFTTLPKRDHTMGRLVDAWRRQAPEAYERAISGGGEGGELAKYGDGQRAAADDRGYESSSSSESNSTVGRNGSGSKSGVEQRGGGATGGDGSSKGPHAATKADTPDLEKQALHTRLPSEPKKVYELLYHKESFLKGIWEDEGMHSESRRGSYSSRRVLTNDIPAQTFKSNLGPMASGRLPIVDRSAARSGVPSVRARKPSFSPTDARIGGGSKEQRGRRVFPQARGASRQGM